MPRATIDVNMTVFVYGQSVVVAAILISWCRVREKKLFILIVLVHRPYRTMLFILMR